MSDTSLTSDTILRLYIKKGETMQLYDDFGIKYNDVHYKCIFREIEDYEKIIAEDIILKDENKRLQKRCDELEKLNAFVLDTHTHLKEHNKLLQDKVSTGKWITVKRTGFEKVFIGPDE